LRNVIFGVSVVLVGAAFAAPSVGADTPIPPPNQVAEPAREPDANAYPIKRRVRYSFTLQNSTAQPVEGASLAAYAPVRTTSSQRVRAVTSSSPAQVELDAWGNQILHFQVGTLAPFAARVVTVDAELELSDKPMLQALPAQTADAFSKPERYIEADDPEIKRIASMLKADAPTKTARNIYDWVRQNLRSLPFTPEDRGARQALALKAGDCTEHAYLFAALARASGIPARAMGGFVLAESGVLDPRDYHNWAEFYADGAWHLADPQRGRFAKNASQYVAMRVISSTLPNQLGDSHRFSVAGRGLKASMN
jgi:transglutaminase-like putative cysteine protease